MTNIWLQLLEQHKAIAVIRSDNLETGYQMALAAAAGGINLIEITWNTEHPEKLVSKLKTDLPQCTVGVGTILDLQQLKSAVEAGAQFVFSPHFDPSILNACLHSYGIPCVPGVFSPTEIVSAWQQGAKAVKVFPIKSLGGAEYIKCLQGPLNHIPLIPTGGITINNARLMLDSGAIAVGISSNLFPQQAIATKDWDSITTRTQFLLQALHGPKNCSPDIICQKSST